MLSTEYLTSVFDGTLVSNLNIMKQDNNDLIKKLIIAKRISKPMRPGISKYIGIYNLNGSSSWIIKSVLVNEPKSFNYLKEAEDYYEKIVKSKGIDLEYVTRKI